MFSILDKAKDISNNLKGAAHTLKEAANVVKGNSITLLKFAEMLEQDISLRLSQEGFDEQFICNLKIKEIIDVSVVHKATFTFQKWSEEDKQEILKQLKATAAKTLEEIYILKDEYLKAKNSGIVFSDPKKLQQVKDHTNKPLINLKDEFSNVIEKFNSKDEKTEKLHQASSLSIEYKTEEKPKKPADLGIRYLGYTRLLTALVGKKWGEAEDFIKAGDDPSLFRDQGEKWLGYNALHIAVYYNQLGVVKVICNPASRHGNFTVAVNARIERPRGENPGFTPLLLALKFQYWDIAEELIKAGADPSVRRDRGEEWFGYNALHIAVYYNQLGIAKAICNPVSRHGNFAVAIDARIERSGGESFGLTPLLLALKSQYWDMAEELINAGADPSMFRDRGEEWYGYNALHIAVYHNQLRIVKAICVTTKHKNFKDAINARIERSDGENPGFTPLLLALRFQYWDVAEELTNTGADPSITRNKGEEWYGYNALHLAVYYNRFKTIYVICNANHPNLKVAINSPIDRRGGEYPGQTPQEMAEKRGQTEISKLFIQLEQQLQLPISPATHLATMFGSTSIVSLSKDKKSEKDKENKGEEKSDIEIEAPQLQEDLPKCDM